MDTLTLLQHYWWLIISLLGATLVFLLFVQGGQGLLYVIGRTEEERAQIVGSLGRKWELTFTTLVTFGGAFFASFPLFYSTSFGGAVYVWMAILLVFVLQAVSYEYRRKPSNVFGEKTYNAFLIINGIAGPLLLGTAVSTLFTGGCFTINRSNLTDLGGDLVISQWATPWHGLEAVAEWRNVLLGVSVTLLAMTLACQWFMNDIDNPTITERSRRKMTRFGIPGALLLVLWIVLLLTGTGPNVDADGTVVLERNKYLNNLVDMPYVAVLLLVGLVAVLWSLYTGWRGNRKAIWFGGIGTVLAVLALLLTAGWNDTAYYPSLVDLQASLTIRNSSSSLFTLKTMSYVSLFIPFVAAYIGYTWRAMSRKTNDPNRHERH